MSRCAAHRVPATAPGVGLGVGVALGLVLGLGACAAPASSAPDASLTPAADAAPSCGTSATLPPFAVATPTSPASLTASCGTVTVRADAFADGLVRLAYLPPTSTAPRTRPWSTVTLPAPAADAMLAADASGRALVCTPLLAVAIDSSCHVTVVDVPTGRTLAADLFTSPTSVRRDAPASAHYYGLGERTGGLDRRGRHLLFWNTDAYDASLGGWRPDQDPLYQAIPFALVLDDGLAHGVFTDDTHRLELDLAHAQASAITMTTTGPEIVDWVIAGPSLREVLRRYTSLTGRTPPPPRWALGFHQSRWGYASATELSAIAAELRARAVPADGLWLDIQHLDGFRTFTFDPAAFPAPAALLASLAAAHFHVIVIADPGLRVDPAWPIYQDALAGDHFLLTPSLAPYVGQAWPGASSWPDFTRAETRAFWGTHVAALAALGVAGIWLDVNEPTTFPEGGAGTTMPDDVLARGDASPATMLEVHNVYAVLEARATFEALAAADPAHRPFVLSRAGGPGIQRYAAVWTGDAPSTFTSLAQQLPMLLGLGLSGVPFVGSDVGGYSGHASAELYARWMALGSISPFFRAHVTSGVPGQEPWRFGPEVLDLSRALIGDRYRRLPYLAALFDEAASTGAPPLRPMIFEFQDDARFVATDDQAMLGPFLLLAPVVAAGAEGRDVLLPAGRWFDERSGAAYDGPATVHVGATLAALPTFVRAGAILPLSPAGAQSTADAPGADLDLDLYPSVDTAPTSFTLVDDGDGPPSAPVARTRFALTADASGATLTASRTGGFRPPARTVHVRVRRVDHPPSAATLDGAAIAFTYDENDRSVSLAFPDAPSYTLHVSYDPSLSELAPPVTVHVVVTVPAGTPTTAAITIASSANGWQHAPLARTSPTTAEGDLVVPRGAWFFYKYARGDWDTVEKYADCSEASNRYRYGAAGPITDDVPIWRDFCP